ncbi:Xaa-Pro aminopeptidase [Paraburkholderia sediminicola]|uniref:aminopeptidase P family protein n=1 Tax=Paraburkholderia sediminicola TaxID=458836 RepID=UPI0038BADF1D
MFAGSVYIERRAALRKRLRSGIVLLPGNVDAPINFPHNVHVFRQDSTFLYFFGVNRPHIAAIVDIDSGDETVFGDDASLDDEIWLGKTPRLAAQCAQAGCPAVKPYAALADVIAHAIRQGRDVHFLPPYRADTVVELSRLLRCTPDNARERASLALIQTVVALREIKSDVEIDEIEKALAVTDEMHRAAMRAARPGVLECKVVAEMHRVLMRHGLQEAYQSVLTKRGEILHNFNYDLRLEAGDLVVNDSGASSALGYASDVTRTLPVGGRFDSRQRELYELLVQAQEVGIATSRPGVPFANAHRAAVLHFIEGLTVMGFFKGNPQDVMSSGAYAICFPHGLGHQLGLDVHDMESFGEDHVGYDEQFSRSDLFGLRSLRMAKPLKAGMVMTVEPGIYFVPPLIQRWAEEKRHAQFIDYPKFNKHIGYGGMRVEDEILITSTGSRVMGPGTPKTVIELEELLSD